MKFNIELIVHCVYKSFLVSEHMQINGPRGYVTITSGKPVRDIIFCILHSALDITDWEEIQKQIKQNKLNK